MGEFELTIEFLEIRCIFIDNLYFISDFSLKKCFITGIFEMSDKNSYLSMYFYRIF